MTNKRQIKKYISRIGSDVAETILPAAVYTKVMAEEKADEVLGKLSQLQAQALSRLNISFDKAMDSFETSRAYHAAKAAYYRQAYAKAVKEYEDGVQALLKPINEAKK